MDYADFAKKNLLYEQHLQYSLKNRGRKGERMHLRLFITSIINREIK